MNTRHAFVVAFLIGWLLAARGDAQAPAPPPADPPPVLTAEQRLTIETFELRAELALARIQVLQAQVGQIQRDAQGYLTGLKREGWDVQKTDQGWVYVKAKP